MLDSYSFPYNSSALPALALGAWSPNAVYQPADIAAVVQRGRDRGVRVKAKCTRARV
jgi:hypothetical protein